MVVKDKFLLLSSVRIEGFYYSFHNLSFDKTVCIGNKSDLMTNIFDIPSTPVKCMILAQSGLDILIS